MGLGYFCYQEHGSLLKELKQQQEKKVRKITDKTLKRAEQHVIMLRHALNLIEGVGVISIPQLAKKIGVTSQTLYTWLK